MNSYHKKYLKYKQKYINLKGKMNAGAPSTPVRKSNPNTSLGSIRKKQKVSLNKPSWMEIFEDESVVRYLGKNYNLINFNKKEDTLKLPSLYLESIDESPPERVSVNFLQSRGLKGYPTRTIYLFGGSLCPPHKGHFKIISDYFKTLSDNDMIFIGINDEDSHNFSYKIAIQIIQSFINLSEFQDKVKVFQLSVSNSFPQLEILKNADIFLEGKKLPITSYKDDIKLLVGSDYNLEPRRSLLDSKIEEAEEYYKINIDKVVLERGSELSSTILSSLAKEYVNDQQNPEFFIKVQKYIPDVFKTQVKLLELFYQELFRAAS